MTHESDMTCAEFEALLGDYLDEGVLTGAQRADCEVHRTGCPECAALVADLRTIVQDAGDLSLRSPSRDLWSEIETRIEAPVVSLNSRNTAEFAVASTLVVDVAPLSEIAPVVRRRAFVARLTARQMALAASLLVAVTAGVTYRITIAEQTVRSADLGAITPSTAPVPSLMQQVSQQTAQETFDREIASLRKVVSDRRAELDSGTVAVLEKNLKLIDQAIAESKAALAKDPASAFLEDRLTRAYDSKLQLLRGVATIPQRS